MVNVPLLTWILVCTTEPRLTDIEPLAGRDPPGGGPPVVNRVPCSVPVSLGVVRCWCAVGVPAVPENTADRPSVAAVVPQAPAIRMRTAAAVMGRYRVTELSLLQRTNHRGWRTPPEARLKTASSPLLCGLPELQEPQTDPRETRIVQTGRARTQGTDIERQNRTDSQVASLTQGVGGRVSLTGVLKRVVVGWPVQGREPPTFDLQAG